MATSSNERPDLEELPAVMDVPHHLAPFLGVSENLVYECIRRGDLPAHRLGRRIVVSKAALVRWLEGAEDDERTFSDSFDAGNP